MSYLSNIFIQTRDVPSEIPRQSFFNQEVRLDIMFLDGAAVLHTIDVGTNFSATRFIERQDTATIWNTFLRAWSTMYIGYPESMLTDQGFVFMSEEWGNSCESASINLRHTGTESHNSLGAGETYHSMLRRIYNKVGMEFPKIPAEVRLSLSVKAMNDSAGPDGLVPSLLVFGVLPTMPIVRARSTTQEQRIEAMAEACNESEKIIAQRCVQHGLQHRPPPATDYRFSVGQLVYAYRENLKHTPVLIWLYLSVQRRLCWILESAQALGVSTFLNLRQHSCHPCPNSFVRLKLEHSSRRLLTRQTHVAHYSRMPNAAKLRV